ncbi:hypothetical protein ACFVT5_40885 [Streptomyces sp. NPDC058001]|uniref:hypothetical protein n=1 Tax=Streptomyces sp. NPDC058001 TaxID=3346300 RepID=UPI0036E799F5
MAIYEPLPVRPRKASASRRRRNTTRLPYRLAKLAPGAVTILLVSTWTDAKGPTERTFLATARDATGAKVQLPPGGSRDIAALVQGAFPGADWDRNQTWHADGNHLTTLAAKPRWATDPGFIASVQARLIDIPDDFMGNGR